MASMYAVYHGPDGLKRIARRVHGWTARARRGPRASSASRVRDERVLRHACASTSTDGRARQRDRSRGSSRGINLRALPTTARRRRARRDDHAPATSHDLLDAFAPTARAPCRPRRARRATRRRRSEALRPHEPLPHPPGLQHATTPSTRCCATSAGSRRATCRSRTSMIPLGSCTMKLNATSEMIPVTWPEFGRLHPFAPAEQTARLPASCSSELEAWLAEITGFAAVSLQPNAGSQGEYAGLLVDPRATTSRAARRHRNVCLIPTRAHGTNPASAVMAGMQGRRRRVRRATATSTSPTSQPRPTQHADDLAALMVTYPSTHGVFEEAHPRDLRDRPRARRAGLHGRRQHERAGRPVPARRLSAPTSATSTCTRPSASRTAAAAPAWGRSASRRTSRRSCPAHPLVAAGGAKAIGPVSAAPCGRASILPISWVVHRA